MGDSKKLLAHLAKVKKGHVKGIFLKLASPFPSFTAKYLTC